ncbi:MAG: nitrate reductase molybdenum cofactor assembly chaperone [Bacillota bacterium]
MVSKEVLQLVSLFLQYPTQEWVEKDLEQAIADLNLEERNTPILSALQSFLLYLRENSLLKLAQNYVQTFDFNEKTSLHLSAALVETEKEQGKLLLSLKKLYEEGGFYLKTAELPDYLPLVLEFLAIAEEKHKKKLLIIVLPALQALRLNLTEIGSPYLALLEQIFLLNEKYLPKGLQNHMEVD